MKRLKPGDKARVIGNKTANGQKYHKYPVGTEVDIVKLYEGTYDCLSASGEEQEIRDSDLEPIEPVQEEESFKNIARRSFLKYDGVNGGYSSKYECYIDGAEWAKEYFESTISRLKSEIEELKRKA